MDFVTSPFLLLPFPETCPNCIWGGSKTCFSCPQGIGGLISCCYFLATFMYGSLNYRQSLLSGDSSTVACHKWGCARAFEQSLEDTHHYKILVQATVCAHDWMKQFWREFAASHNLTLSTEIEVSSILPTLSVLFLIFTCLVPWLPVYRHSQGFHLLAHAFSSWQTQWIYQLAFGWSVHPDIHGPLASTSPRLINFSFSPFWHPRNSKNLVPISTKVHIKHMVDVIDVKILIHAFCCIVMGIPPDHNHKLT